MSADNYNFIRKINSGCFRVWTNLSASCDRDPQLMKQHEDFPTLQDAIAGANAQGYTAYGNEIELEPPMPDDRLSEEECAVVAALISDCRSSWIGDETGTTFCDVHGRALNILDRLIRRITT